MSHIPTIDEGTTVSVDFTFLDVAGNPQVPTAITYRVDCLTNDQEIVDDTAIGVPASTVTVTVNGSDNDLIDQDNDTEKRVITVLADYGGGDQIPYEQMFYLRNLKKYPFPTP